MKKMVIMLLKQLNLFDFIRFKYTHKCTPLYSSAIMNNNLNQKLKKISVFVERRVKSKDLSLLFPRNHTTFSAKYVSTTTR